MAATKESIENISLDKGQTHEIIHRVSRMALLDGVQRKITVETLPEQVEQLPFTLFPSVFPSHVIEDATAIAPHFQTLMYKVSNDYEFLYDCLKNIIEVDEFTGQLWRIYETVRKEGIKQPVSLLITRNDFMMENSESSACTDLQIKQVEINTFASGAAGMASAMTDVHRYSLTLAGVPFRDEQLRDNQPIKGLAQGLVDAWKYYKNDRAAIMFVVGFEERGTPDHIWLEREIFNLNRHIPVIYRTFDKLVKQVTIGTNMELLVCDKEIGVVYYRHGYSPEQYPTEKEFELRLQIERSTAIKCPTISAHLTGCKKVQQVLCSPGVLERFVDDKEIVLAMRRTFVGQFDLDKGSKGEENTTKAIEKSDFYVIKPQREGGGNNYFGEEMKLHLEKIRQKPERCCWVLMERIRPCKQRNRLIRNGLTTECRDVESELSIFGVHIGTASGELANHQCGYLLRTKPKEINEGGIIHGQSCYDSMLLS